MVSSQPDTESILAKGSKREREAAEKLRMKAQVAKAGGESKYHTKRMLIARGDLLPTSPFFMDLNDPSAETIEQARERERTQRNVRQYVHHAQLDQDEAE